MLLLQFPDPLWLEKNSLINSHRPLGGAQVTKDTHWLDIVSETKELSHQYLPRYADTNKSSCHVSLSVHRQVTQFQDILQQNSCSRPQAPLTKDSNTAFFTMGGTFLFMGNAAETQGAGTNSHHSAGQNAPTGFQNSSGGRLSRMLTAKVHDAAKRSSMTVGRTTRNLSRRLSEALRELRYTRPTVNPFTMCIPEASRPGRRRGPTPNHAPPELFFTPAPPVPPSKTRDRHSQMPVPLERPIECGAAAEDPHSPELPRMSPVAQGIPRAEREQWVKDNPERTTSLDSAVKVFDNATDNPYVPAPGPAKHSNYATYKPSHSSQPIVPSNSGQVKPSRLTTTASVISNEPNYAHLTVDEAKRKCKEGNRGSSMRRDEMHMEPFPERSSFGLPIQPVHPVGASSNVQSESSKLSAWEAARLKRISMGFFQPGPDLNETAEEIFEQVRDTQPAMHQEPRIEHGHAELQVSPTPLADADASPFDRNNFPILDGVARTLNADGSTLSEPQPASSESNSNSTLADENSASGNFEWPRFSDQDFEDSAAKRYQENRLKHLNKRKCDVAAYNAAAEQKHTAEPVVSRQRSPLTESTVIPQVAAERVSVPASSTAPEDAAGEVNGSRRTSARHSALLNLIDGSRRYSGQVDSSPPKDLMEF